MMVVWGGEDKRRRFEWKMQSVKCSGSFPPASPSPTSWRARSRCSRSPLRTARPRTGPGSRICRKCCAWWDRWESRGRCLSPWTYPPLLDCRDSCRGGTSAPASCVEEKDNGHLRWGRIFLWQLMWGGRGMGEGTGGDVSPVRPLDVIGCGDLVDSQHEVERLASGGQGALPLMLSHDSLNPQTGEKPEQSETVCVSLLYKKTWRETPNPLESPV